MHRSMKMWRSWHYNLVSVLLEVEAAHLAKITIKFRVSIYNCTGCLKIISFPIQRLELNKLANRLT